MSTSTSAAPSVDELLIGEAIRIAQTGVEAGQFPFGAVIALGSRIAASAHNSVKASVDPTAHAEIVAIRKACTKLYTTSLEEATLYTTCEPCLMCLSACFWAGIRRIVFGASIADAI
ncbi:MAG: nucleoside deaminase, partial [Thermoprotei archaeon]